MPNYYDPNDPDNPFSPKYKPRFVYEFHVVQPQKKATKQNTQMLLPQAEVDVPISKHDKTLSVPGYVVECELELDFQGTVQALKQIPLSAYQQNQASIQNNFRKDVANLLEQIQLQQVQIFKSIINNSQATLTLPSNGYTTNTATFSSKGVIVDSTAETSAGSAGVSLSSTSPTTITFHFESKQLTAQNSNSKFTGNLSLQLSATVTPTGLGKRIENETANIAEDIEDNLNKVADGINQTDVIIFRNVVIVVTGIMAGITLIYNMTAPVVAAMG